MGDLSPHFSRAEFACRCGCGADKMKSRVIAYAERLRELAGAPVVVNSGRRCAKWNKKVHGAAGSRHLTGEAIDFEIEGISREEERRLAIAAGFSWVRDTTKGDHAVHADIRGLPPEKPTVQEATEPPRGSTPGEAGNTPGTTEAPAMPVGDGRRPYAGRPGAFDPSRVISDVWAEDSDVMDVAAVREFLAGFGSILLRVDGPRVIVSACTKNGISPKLILVKLQQEQSLIARKIATERELDRALGVGVYEEGKVANPRYHGFARQVHGACETFRKWIDVSGADVRAGKRLAVRLLDDGQPLQVCANPATRAIYEYTPHLASAEELTKLIRRYFPGDLERMEF